MPLKLLIADDSVTIQKVVDLAFEDEDVSVHAAGDGEEALDKIDKIQPDIIIADTDMPKLDGFELCQKIKNNEQLKKISICLLHSDFEEFDEEKFRSCGADGHLSKPFKADDIKNKVTELTGALNNKEEKDQALNDDLLGKDNLQNMEKLSEDIEELEILPLNEVEKEIQSEEVLELKSEDAISEANQDDENLLTVEEDSIIEPEEEEIAKFMEDIEETSKTIAKHNLNKDSNGSPAKNKKETQEDLKKELEEFNKVLDIPVEDMGEAVPFFEDNSKTSPSKDEEVATSALKNKEEKLKEPYAEKTSSDYEVPGDKSPLVESEPSTELKSIHDNIKEEKEDLIEEAGVLDEKTFEEQDKNQIATNKPSSETEQLKDDDFEKLIGGYIKKVIEKILQEAIQNEIAGITDKIIEAVERIAREITPDISKTIIQNEIQKLKNSKE